MDRIVNPKQTYSFEQLCYDITALAERYHQLLSVKIIGYSVQERPIYALKLGHGKVNLLLHGAHHAREWLTTALLMDQVETYCVESGSTLVLSVPMLEVIRTDVSLWFIPMVNPDGVTLVQEGVTSFANQLELIEWNGEKNDFQAWKANARGVDLNRQYPIDWQGIKDCPIGPAPSHYKGAAPLSEPEVKAVYQFVQDHDIQLALAYHSSGQEIYWKYKSTGKLTNDAKRIAEHIKEKTGYQLIDPGSDPSGGGFTDWFIAVMKRPSFTIEISPYIGPRPVPLSYYDQIWQENRAVPLLLIEEVMKR